MTPISHHPNQFNPQLTERLQQRASQNGRTIEAEITAILASILAAEPASSVEPNLATAINQRFADTEDFEIPEIPRESSKNPPIF